MQTKYLTKEYLGKLQSKALNDDNLFMSDIYTTVRLEIKSGQKFTNGRLKGFVRQCIQEKYKANKSYNPVIDKDLIQQLITRDYVIFCFEYDEQAIRERIKGIQKLTEERE